MFRYDQIQGRPTPTLYQKRKRRIPTVIEDGRADSGFLPGELLNIAFDGAPHEEAGAGDSGFQQGQLLNIIVPAATPFEESGFGSAGFRQGERVEVHTLLRR